MLEAFNKKVTLSFGHYFYTLKAVFEPYSWQMQLKWDILWRRRLGPRKLVRLWCNWNCLSKPSKFGAHLSVLEAGSGFVSEPQDW